MATNDQLQGAAQQYFGRQLSPEELAFHQQSAGDNYDAIFRNSTEGQTYAQRNQQNQAPSAGSAPLAPSPAPAGAAPGGYDYTQLRNNWLNDPNAQAGNISSYLAAHPEWSQGVTALGSGETIRLPNGAIVDTTTNFGGPNAARYWGGTGANEFNYETGANTGTPAGGGGGGGGGGIGAPGGAGGPGGGIEDALRSALLRLMGRSEPGAIDVNTDPNLSPQARAYASARQRAAGQERAQTAERAAFQGLNSGGQGSGAFDTSVAGIQENAGRDIASQQAGLVGQEVANRRNDLQQSLQLANAIGARDQAAQLQQQLAQLDNTYRYASLNQQQGQFNDTYGLNRAQLEQDANRNAILAALGGG